MLDDWWIRESELREIIEGVLGGARPGDSPSAPGPLRPPMYLRRTWAIGAGNVTAATPLITASVRPIHVRQLSYYLTAGTTGGLMGSGISRQFVEGIPTTWDSLGPYVAQANSGNMQSVVAVGGDIMMVVPQGYTLYGISYLLGGAARTNLIYLSYT